MKRSKVKDLLLKTDAGSDVQVKGWVRTKRGIKDVVFIALNDGSTINNIQIVADAKSFGDALIKDIATGACIGVTGKLVESRGQGRMSNKCRDHRKIWQMRRRILPSRRKSFHEFLREIAHCDSGPYLRCRIRISMQWPLQFINILTTGDSRYLHTPIVTAAIVRGRRDVPCHNDDLRTCLIKEDGNIDYTQISS